MNDDDRKQIITNYIKNHPDCKAEEIVEGVSDKMSRALVFRYLPELIKEKIILDNSKNRRDRKFSINNNNLILEVQDELNNFKKELFYLIQKTETFAKNKNYSSISNEIGLSSEEIKKWTNADYQKYMSYLGNTIKKGQDVMRKNSSLLDENMIKIKELFKVFNLESKYILSDINEDTSLDEKKRKELFKFIESYSKNKLPELNKSILILDEIIDNFNQRIAIINDSHSIYNKFLSVNNITILLKDIISILHYVFDLFFYRSIIWSSSISKEMLVKLNDIFFNSFIDIQNKIIKLISHHIFSYFDSTKILEEFLRDLKLYKKYNIFAEDQDGILYYNYKEIGLENEIKNVINTILPMCKETKKYGILPPKLTYTDLSFLGKGQVIETLSSLKNIAKKLKSFKVELENVYNTLNTTN